MQYIVISSTVYEYLLVVHSFSSGELGDDVAADENVEDDGNYEGERDEGASGHGGAPVHGDPYCPVFQFTMWNEKFSMEIIVEDQFNFYLKFFETLSISC